MTPRADITKVVTHFAKVDPRLSQIISTIDFDDWFDGPTANSDELFSDLTRTIVGQQLAGGAASAIFGRFSDHFSGNITPEKVLTKTAEDLRNLGVSWAKARSMLDLAEKTKSGALQLNDLSKMKDADVIQQLVQVKGIGVWTAEMFLMFRLGREDIFSFGDLGLKNGLKKYLAKENLSIEEIKHQVEKWHPYKTYGAIAMWHLLDSDE